MLSQGIRVLVVEDEALQREMLMGHLESKGYLVVSAGTSEAALEQVQARRIDVVLSDYRLPGMTGIELLEAIRKVNPELPFLMVTAYATVDVAVKAMRMGAVDFLTKPIEFDALDALLGRIVQNRKLTAENERLRRRLAQLGSEDLVLGTSCEFRKVLDLASRVAASGSTVLITGETGCGKELIADLIQSQSPRRVAPFVKVNCGAIPGELFESELFGHRRGAFTGATNDRTGRLAEADGGTLMLDEIGELPLQAQVKMLRVLESGQYFPVGSDKVRTADVRLIASTNRDLAAMVQAGQFREDLYFRISVVPIHIPPLRARREDVGPLLDYFLGHLPGRLGTGPRELSAAARDALLRYDWPGNVRQLRNVAERLLLLAHGPIVDLADLPDEVVAPVRPRPGPFPAIDTTLDAAVAELERTCIRNALEGAGGNQTRAAELLGLSERVLRYKLKKYGIARGPHQ